MNNYSRTSHDFARTKEERLQLKSDLLLYQEEEVDRLLKEHEKGVKRPGALLLDSSLISTTKNKFYTHKIIQCGKYYQVYNFYEVKKRKDNNKERMKDVPINMIDVDTEDLSKTNYKNELRTIETKNIIRSKIQLQRLVKANEDSFKTFITLTFAENIEDVSLANKKFKNFRDSLSRKLRQQKKEFLYVCVPEFQKRGAVHYHLLTNLDIKNSEIIIPQKGKKHQYDVKYWNQGFSSVQKIKNINVVGYLSKYMTKDIDQRLFGKRRYLYSLNLIQPTTSYINLSEEQDNSHLSFIELFSELKYKQVYSDKLGQAIEFREFKKRSEKNDNLYNFK